MMPKNRHLQIGGFVFDGLDQLDFTGPFEVLSRLSNSTFHIFGKTAVPVRDIKGLILTPSMGFDEVPALDVLVVPGGNGVNRLMEDAGVLEFLQHQAAGATLVFSICTGALLCGAAGLLTGQRATTHWASHHLLSSLGANPVDDRVVVDGPLVTTAGVTSGIDGALRVVAMLRGDEEARTIQLYLEYSPSPPFASGTPATAGPERIASVRASSRTILEERAAICERIAARSTD